MLIIFAIFLLFSVFAIFFQEIWPIIRFGIFSPCWGVFVSDMNSVTFLKSKPHSVTVGDCVDSFNFVNKRQLASSFRSLECPANAEGFLIAIPRFSETQSGLKFWLWPEDLWEEAEQAWKERFGGIRPICKGLNKPFTAVPEPLYGPPSGSITYCIQIIEQETTFDLSIQVGKCVES